jgi:hypothetical protein
MCPLDTNLDKAIWYPDEEICRNKDFTDLLWIQNQKKISKVKADTHRYFTKQMLDKKMRVRDNIQGVNPD